MTPTNRIQKIFSILYHITGAMHNHLFLFLSIAIEAAGNLNSTSTRTHFDT